MSSHHIIIWAFITFSALLIVNYQGFTKGIKLKNSQLDSEFSKIVFSLIPSGYMAEKYKNWQLTLTNGKDNIIDNSFKFSMNLDLTSDIEATQQFLIEKYYKQLDMSEDKLSHFNLKFNTIQNEIKQKLKSVGGKTVELTGIRIISLGILYENKKEIATIRSMKDVLKGNGYIIQSQITESMELVNNSNYNALFDQFYSYIRLDN